MSRTSRVVIAWPLGLICVTCGHKNPADPGTPQPALYSLEMTGFDISDDPRFPACDPIFIPKNGKKVITTVALVREGSDRVARSSTKELGNIELRFHQNGTGKTPADRMAQAKQLWKGRLSIHPI